MREAGGCAACSPTPSLTDDNGLHLPHKPPTKIALFLSIRLQTTTSLLVQYQLGFFNGTHSQSALLLQPSTTFSNNDFQHAWRRRRDAIPIPQSANQQISGCYTSLLRHLHQHDIASTRVGCTDRQASRQAGRQAGTRIVLHMAGKDNNERAGQGRVVMMMAMDMDHEEEAPGRRDKEWMPQLSCCTYVPT